YFPVHEKTPERRLPPSAKNAAVAAAAADAAAERAAQAAAAVTRAKNAAARFTARAPRMEFIADRPRREMKPSLKTIESIAVGLNTSVYATRPPHPARPLTSPHTLPPIASLVLRRCIMHDLARALFS